MGEKTLLVPDKASFQRLDPAVLPGGEGAEVGVFPGGSRRTGLLVPKLLKKKKKTIPVSANKPDQNRWSLVVQPHHDPPGDSGATQRRRAEDSPGAAEPRSRSKAQESG